MEIKPKHYAYFFLTIFLTLLSFGCSELKEADNLLLENYLKSKQVDVEFVNPYYHGKYQVENGVTYAYVAIKIKLPKDFPEAYKENKKPMRDKINGN